MKVSVIIPTRNRSRFVFRSVRSLLDQTFPSDDYEIVVCCDGCTDNTEEVLRGFSDDRIKIISIFPAGQAAALNAAIAVARGDIGIFLDDEMEADQSLLDVHVKAHCKADNPPIAVTGYSSVILPIKAKPLLQEIAQNYENYFLKLNCETHSVPSNLNGGHFSAPLTAIRYVGGFNDRYQYRTDFELATRWIENGYRIGFEKKAITKMHLAVTSDAVIKRARRRAALDCLLAREHPWCVRWLPFYAVLSGVS